MGISQKWVVSHPGTQHSIHTALAVEKAGLLYKFYTSFYYAKTGLISQFLSQFPNCFTQPLERELLRRRKADLPPEKIQFFPLHEFLFVFSSRTRFLQRFSEGFWDLKNNAFDRMVAGKIREKNICGVIGFDSSALETLKAANAIGAIGILDFPTSHLRSALETYRDEAELHPEFADSLIFSVSQKKLDTSDNEKKFAKFIFCSSEYSRKTLIDHGISPEKIHVIPYGVNTEQFQAKTDFSSKEFKILFVGGVSQRKGIKYLLEAIKRLSLPQSKLTVIGGILGSGGGLNPYRSLFTHHQPLPHDEVATFFRQSDIFVFPALHEGSALVVYEALASGIPVITTPNAGSIVRDGVDGFIVPIRDVEAIMEKIEILYKDRDLRVWMGLNARKRAEEYTWNRYYLEVERIIREISCHSQ